MKFLLSHPFFNAGPRVQRLFGFVSIYLLSNSTRFARVMMSSIKKNNLDCTILSSLARFWKVCLQIIDSRLAASCVEGSISHSVGCNWNSLTPSVV